MTVDRTALLAELRKIDRSRASVDKKLAVAFSRVTADLTSVAALLRHADTRLQDMSSSRMRAQRIHALRFLVQSVGKLGFFVLRGAASEFSTSQYRIIFRERLPSELPDRGKDRARFDREFETLEAAARVMRLADRAGVSLEEAFEHVQRRARLSWGFDAFKQRLKLLSTAAKARGYADPYAILEPLALNAHQLDDLSEPRLTVDRLARKGRPRKKR